VNPVLRRELVERWRSRRAVVTLTVYLAVLAGLQYLLYRAGLSVLNQQFGFFGGMDPATAGPMLGRFLLEGLLFFILMLVLFVAPGYAAATLSGERERRTLPLLQTTLLRPSQIVLGKLGASTAWLVLLVAAALPLGGASFFLGGVALGDLLRGIAYVVVIGVCIAAMGIGVSSMTRRTTGSVVLTYGIVLALTAGTLFVSAVEFFVRANAGRVEPPIALYANPFYGLADAARAQRASASMMGGGLPSPLAIIAESLPGNPMGGAVAMDTMVVAEDGVMLGDADARVPGMEPFGPEAGRQGVWLKVMGLYALGALAGVGVASRRVRGHQTSARVRAGRRRDAGGPDVPDGASGWGPPAAAGAGNRSEPPGHPGSPAGPLPESPDGGGP
jgi:ABC-2 type transport system permease protein